MPARQFTFGQAERASRSRWRDRRRPGIRRRGRGGSRCRARRRPSRRPAGCAGPGSGRGPSASRRAAACRSHRGTGIRRRRSPRGGGREAIEERQLREQHGEVGGEFRHRTLPDLRAMAPTGVRFAARCRRPSAGSGCADPSTPSISWLSRIDRLGSRQRISSNSLTLSISAPIEMLVTRSRMNSSTTGTWCSAMSACARSKAALNSLADFDPDRLAAERLRRRPRDRRHSRDGVAVGLRVDVLEGETDLEIHLEGALRLADQAEVGIVHHHMQEGQLVLRADRELLDHELEVVVAGQRHDLPRPDRRRGRRAPRASVQPSGPACPQLIQLRGL